jgi:deazaflavin-dependent oxidoreductase (nitroreductase family)
VRIASIRWMPRLLPVIVRVDAWLYRRTGGRVMLLALAGLPNLVLHVSGRRSGRQRDVALLCVLDHGAFLVAGSHFGQDRTPSWVHNLRDADRAEVTFRGRRGAVVVEELVDDRLERAWPVMRRTWPTIDLYRRRADRPIPVFRLRPVGRSRTV